MPIYEYRCQECGRELERLQKLSDPVLTDCPACDKPALKRLISAAGFRLKGGGWYETDFKSGNRRNVDGGGSGGNGGASSGDSPGKGDSKGDSKSKAESKSSAGEGGSKSAGSSAA